MIFYLYNLTSIRYEWLSAPLVHIKKALKDIKKEIFEMDINIAVAEHVIVESKLRDKSLESHLIRSSGFSWDYKKNL